MKTTNSIQRIGNVRNSLDNRTLSPENEQTYENDPGNNTFRESYNFENNQIDL